MNKDISLPNKMYRLKDGIFGFGDSGDIIDQYFAFIESIKQVEAPKLFCNVHSKDELMLVSRLGLLLSDIVILCGHGPEGCISCERGDDTISMILPRKHRYDIDVKLPQEAFEGIAGPALATFHPGFLNEWYNQAKLFFNDGRLFYLPGRVAYRAVSKSDESYMVALSDVPVDAPIKKWYTVATSELTGSQVFLPESIFMSKEDTVILNISLPFLNNISFKQLYDVMEQERDSLIQFRKTVNNAISSLKHEAKDIEDFEKIRKIGYKINRDVIDPEISSLNLLFKKIVQVRSFKIAGVCLGLASLSISALSNVGLIPLISNILGAGGIGVVAKEYADYRAEILSLKEKPWYFAWKLSRLSNK